MARPAEEINIALRKHQAEIDDWRYRLVTDDLHVWADRFILEFKLQTTTPAIMIRHLRSGVLGHHICGRNGFGLRHEIAISQEHLEGDEYWEVIGTLLHELLHAEQEDRSNPGRRNHHNHQLRERAYEFGLIVDARGRQEYAQAPNPFLDLLEKYGVKTPELPPPTKTSSLPGKAKLKPWICGCRPRPIHLQVAVSDLKARCLKCGRLFKPKAVPVIKERWLHKTTCTVPARGSFMTSSESQGHAGGNTPTAHEVMHHHRWLAEQGADGTASVPDTVKDTVGLLTGALS